MSKKKIIHYITTLNDGGAETLVKNYCLLLDKEKFEIKVVVLWLMGESSNLKILRENGIEIIVLFNKWNHLKAVLNKFFHKWIVAYYFRDVLIKEKPDVIHVHLELLQTLLPLRALLKDTKLFYTCHSRPQNFLGDIRPREHVAAVKLLKANNLQIIALHNDMAVEINKLFSINNTLVIKNGIDLQLYRSVTETKSEIRRSLNIPENAFVIGHIGRFNKIKNHSFLLDVFELIHQKRPNSHLLLIGSGELESEIRARIEQKGLVRNVTILSHRSDVPRLLKAMDVFVFPSLYEGFGIVLIEAQAAGKVCYVSDTINKSTFVSDKIIPLSLNDGPEVWCKEILNPSSKGEKLYDINNYNIRTEVIKLQQLYLEANEESTYKI